jgi:hypothetical protein
MRLRHRAMHLRIWLALAVLLPAILGAGLLLRQPREAVAPVRLAP